MTCKDCYHYEACSGYLISDLDKDVWDYCAKGKTDEIPDIEDRCSEFKNKADVVEVKHGEWVKVAAYNDGIINTAKCSICETFQPIGEWDWQAYCPNCGAKMDKKEGAEK